MKKLATALLISIIGLIPVTSFASLPGKWDVTEFVTIKTTLGKIVQFQAQTNQTTFSFNNDHSFQRANQGVLLFSGTYKSNTQKSTFTNAIQSASYSQNGNINSIKSRIEAYLLERGHNMLSFKVKTNKFTGQIFNETTSTSNPLGNLLPDDVHTLRGAYSYTITVKVQSTLSDKKPYNMTIKVDSNFSGSKQVDGLTYPQPVIDNKKELWPLL